MNYQPAKRIIYHDAREEIELECLRAIQNIRRWDQVLFMIENEVPEDVSASINRQVYQWLGQDLFSGLTRW